MDPSQLLERELEVGAGDCTSLTSLFDFFREEQIPAPLLLDSNASDTHDLVKVYSEAIQEMIEWCAVED